MHYASHTLQHCIAISWTWERVCLVLEHDSKNKKLLDGNKSIRLTWRMCDLPRCCWSILEIAGHYGLHFNCPRQLTFQWRVRQLRACLWIYGSRVGVCARCVEDATKSRLPSSAIVDCNFFPVVFRFFFFWKLQLILVGNGIYTLSGDIISRICMRMIIIVIITFF